jgi:hypothetical protein
MINFVDTLIPEENATTHFCFIGATGSGKTVCIRILMQSVLPVVRNNKVSDVKRALVYDAKRDILPVLHGIVGPDNYYYEATHKVVTLNPFDARSYAWDICKDITDLAHAQEMATILIPKEPNSTQPFFGNAARELLRGVITVFILSGKRWSLRDVVCAMKSQARLAEVLASTPNTKHLPGLFLSHEETAKNIMSEIASRIGPYEVIAALWHQAEKQRRLVSLNDWLNGDREFILVLGCDHTSKAAIDAINQVIFKRISELILDQDDDESGKARTWIFLDEFVRAGKLDGVVELATEGRSKGAALVLGFQDINGARAVYGKEVAEEIVGQCSNIAILRLQSPDTADWASRLFGKYERAELKETFQTGYSGEQETGGKSRVVEKVQREAVLASEFLYMPPTSRTNGLHGVRYIPDIGRVAFPIEGEKLFGMGKTRSEWSGGLLWPKRQDEKGVVPRDAAQQHLLDWSEDDFQRLGFPELWGKERTLTQADKLTEQWNRLEQLARRAFYFGKQPDEALEKEIAVLPPHEKELYRRMLAQWEHRYPDPEASSVVNVTKENRRKMRLGRQEFSATDLEDLIQNEGGQNV